jgi:DNA-binding NarL/FixJ family response regulator
MKRHADSADVRPRVLLADNHPQVLAIVAGLLSAHFDVVASVPDGRQAVEYSLRLDPDVIVLDIGMPELDGFQALGELRRMGSRAKILLLTLHQSDAYVAAALRSGAQGYVLKTRIYLDLISAIEHAIEGRLFVPSITSLLPVARTGHTALIHTNDHFYLDEASFFVGGALRAGGPVVMVTSEEPRRGITERLKARGFDLAEAAAQGRYIEQDAAESLSQFMRNERPDPELLAGIVADLDRMRLSAGGERVRLTIFGDMAVQLWRNGNQSGALELERLWSKLTQDLPFNTVCSYSVECFQDDESTRLFPHVCAVHGAISHAVMV